MTTAFVFPGQGADVDPVLDAWRAESRTIATLLERAERGPAGIGARRAPRGSATADAAALQPRLIALCTGITLELARRGLTPDIVAGHSLGELAACAAAGCMSPESAVEVAVTRGQLMAREATRHPGGMVALATSDRAVAERVVAEARSHGLASIAAHNAADQWVVAGEWSALRAIARQHETIPVPVAGPWHTDAMAGAVDEYRAALRHAVTHPLGVSLVCNRTGGIVERAEDVADMLALQLTHPVQWVKTMATLAAFGVTDVVAVGPSRALRSLVRRGLGAGAAIHAVEVPADLETVARALRR